MDLLYETIKTGRAHLDGRSYLLVCKHTRSAAVIDPDLNTALIQEALVRHEARLGMILLTHGHFDHIGDGDRLRALYACPLYIHPLDAPMLAEAAANLSAYMGVPFAIGEADGALHPGIPLHLGRCTINVVHTPGHTPGSCCFLWENLLFSGDTLMGNGYGRTDFPGGSDEDMANSLRRLFTLNPDTLVLGGHGEPGTIRRAAELLQGLL